MHRPLRVTHIIPQIGIGGAELQLCELIKRSNPDQLQHTVLYYSDARDELGYRLYGDSGIRFTRVLRKKTRPLKFVRGLAHAIQRSAPDIVQCWLYSGVVWGRLAALHAGTGCIVVTHRGTDLPRLGALRLLERLTGTRVHYAANSHACARVVADQLKISANLFHVIYNGIDLDQFNLPLDREAIRSELKVPDGFRLVITVGRLTPAKNYPMLLRCARLCRELPLLFVVVGHGELEAELKALAQQFGVLDKVRFLGLRRDVASLLIASDFFCYTSLREGFPNALLEAMGAGLPIITTDFPCAEELIDQGRTGVIVSRDDENAMFEGLVELLGHPARAEHLGAAARQRCLEQFSMEQMVQNTFEYYQRVLGISRSA